MLKGIQGAAGGRNYPMIDSWTPTNGGFFKTKKKPPIRRLKLEGIPLYGLPSCFAWQTPFGGRP
jgi:hypothetical protein